MLCCHYYTLDVFLLDIHFMQVIIVDTIFLDILTYFKFKCKAYNYEDTSYKLRINNLTCTIKCPIGY